MGTITLTQVFRVERTITLEVEGPALDSVAAWEEGNLETPSYDDPRWAERRELQNEECAACGS
jgi:hypothetical protein